MCGARTGCLSDWTWAASTVSGPKQQRHINSANQPGCSSNPNLHPLSIAPLYLPPFTSSPFPPFHYLSHHCSAPLLGFRHLFLPNWTTRTKQVRFIFLFTHTPSPDVTLWLPRITQTAAVREFLISTTKSARVCTSLSSAQLALEVNVAELQQNEFLVLWLGELPVPEHVFVCITCIWNSLTVSVVNRMVMWSRFVTLPPLTWLSVAVF